MKTLAIIPARGGSKGLPGKNIKPLNGTPLLVYSIRAALDSGVLERVCVTTDSGDIADVSRSEGADVVDRPAELSGDSARTVDALLHAVDHYHSAGFEPDIVVLLQPTSPLRNSTHVTEAMKLYSESNARSLFSVVPCEHHPLKSLSIEDDGYLKPISRVEDLDAPRQLLPTMVRQNGAIYINRAQDLREKEGFFVAPVIPFFMTVQDSVDIDTTDDFESARRILESRRA